MANSLQERHQVQVFVSSFSRQSGGRGSAVGNELFCSQVKKKACFAIFADAITSDGTQSHCMLYCYVG